MRIPGHNDESGTETSEPGQLTARPTPPTDRGPASPNGPQPLDLGTGSGRDGLWYVPPGYRADRPAPLILMLHGAGGTAHSGLASFLPLADATGAILLAPDSRGRTWDVILDEYGPDVAFINAALAQTFARFAIDAAHIAAEGFSDGASYALSLGLMNGDLFTHVDFAFTAAFIAIARSLWKGRNDLPPWLTSALVVAGSIRFANIDPSWALVLGGLAGAGMAGAVHRD